MLISFEISGDRNMIKKSQEDSKIKIPYNRSTAHVESKNQRHASKNGQLEQFKNHSEDT